MILTRIRWILRSGPSWGMSGHISISSWSIEVSLGNVADIFKTGYTIWRFKTDICRNFIYITSKKRIYDYKKCFVGISDWSEGHALGRKSKGFSFTFYYRYKRELLQVCYLTRNTSKLISVKKKKEVEIWLRDIH